MRTPINKDAVNRISARSASNTVVLTVANSNSDTSIKTALRADILKMPNKSFNWA